MRAAEQSVPHRADVLIRKVDSHLAGIRAGLHGADLALAERVAAVLRELVIDTHQASAADRARVRAAVHYFVLRRESRDQLLPVRSLAAAHRLVNRTAVHLGRPDLVIGPLQRPSGTPTGPAPTSAPTAPTGGPATTPARSRDSDSQRPLHPDKMSA